MQENRSSLSLKHVAVFAFPGLSHARPHFNLIVKLAKAAPEVVFSYFSSAKYTRSFVSSHKNLPLNLKAYAVEDGVPKDFDLAKSPQKEAEFFIGVMPGNLEVGMNLAVKESGRKITCIFADAFFSSTANNLATEMEVPWVAFMVAAPFGISADLHADEIQELYKKCVDQGQPFLEDQLLEAIPGLSMIRMRDLPLPLSPCKEEDPAMALLLSMITKMWVALPQASAAVFGTYEELNPILVTNDLKSRLRNVLYVGTLTILDEDVRPTSHDDGAAGCLSWLGKQQEASVVYISFGTIAPLPCEEIVALAEAIEAGGFSFLWSLSDRFKGYLPDGFTERTSDLGMVVPWVPQNQVLAHPSVGVHVNHCGYNSVCECMLAGVPMVVRPIWAESFMTRRMVEEVWKIGVGVKDDVFTKSGMLESLDTIFRQEEGKKIRESSKKIREVALKAAGVDGSAARYLKALVEIFSQE